MTPLLYTRAELETRLRIEANLRLIFKAYSRASATSNVRSLSFEDRLDESDSLKIKGFVRFCLDFKINLKVREQIQIFHQEALQGGG